MRSRKFPAVVNCTSIDWFHEWPQEALVSVSRRFLDDNELLTVSNLALSMYQFMLVYLVSPICILEILQVLVIYFF